MSLFEIVLIVTTLLCALVAGFVFAFAAVVMPGIQDLGDRDFLRAFQAMDRVIQRGQPVFMLVWVGSVFSVLAVMLLGVWQLQGLDPWLLMVAGASYLLGVQLPTVAINVPLNNRLQQLKFGSLDDAEVRQARVWFEARWIGWNQIRTGLAILSSVLLLFVILRL